MRRLVGAAIMSRAAEFVCLLAVALAVGSPSASAQTYPSRPVHLILTVAPGGGLDATARLIAERLGQKLGQPVIVENRSGAGGNIAAEHVAHSAPDGYTLLVTSNGHTLNPLIYKSPGYDPLKDFVPIVELTEGPVVLVTQPNGRFKTLKDVVDAARASPGSLSYAHGGLGLPPHIAMEMFKQAAKIDIPDIPYKGAGPALQDTLGGHVPLAMLSLAGAAPHIAAGRLHALASSGAARWPSLPDVPTIAELGYPDVVYLNWQGVLAPAGTPPDIVARLHKEIAAVLDEGPIQERLTAMGAPPVVKGPADFAAMLRADYATNQQIVGKLNLKVN